MTHLLVPSLSYLLRAALATAYELLAVLGPGVAIGAAAHALAVVTERRAQALFGPRPYHVVCGWLGTAVHEGSHALAALLFGHRVGEIKWFDASARDGTLGHVRHGYDPRSVYQQVGNFFIGVAPLIGGTAVVYAAARCLLGPAVFAPASSIALATGGGALGPGALWELGGQVARAVWHLVAALATWDRVASWRFWAFVYAAFAVGGGIRLSRPDLAHAGRGLGVLAALLLLVNLATLWAGDGATRLALAVARAGATYYAVMLLVVAATVAAVGLVVAVPLGARGAWVLAARAGRAARSRG